MLFGSSAAVSTTMFLKESEYPDVLEYFFICLCQKIWQQFLDSVFLKMTREVRSYRFKIP